MKESAKIFNAVLYAKREKREALKDVEKLLSFFGGESTKKDFQNN